MSDISNQSTTPPVQGGSATGAAGTGGGTNVPILQSPLSPGTTTQAPISGQTPISSTTPPVQGGSATGAAGAGGGVNVPISTPPEN